MNEEELTRIEQGDPESLAGCFGMLLLGIALIGLAIFILWSAL